MKFPWLAAVATLVACDLGVSTSVIDGGPPGVPDAADPGAPDAAPGQPDADVDPPAGPHPFGTHGGYHGSGVIFPNHRSQAELDDAVKAFYAQWKDRYLEQACGEGVYRISTGGGTGGNGETYTVSEGHGYGMLITAIMFGADPEAKTIFDGLYRYYQDHPSENVPALMAWSQDVSCNDVNNRDSDTDGDLDIAYALLLAHRQWGSDGAIDYRAAAEKIIAGILEGEVAPANHILIGDWAKGSDQHIQGTRPSDFMVSHVRTFAARTGVARWTAVLDRTYAIVAHMQAQHSPAAGILPDFVVDAASDAPKPAPSGWLEGGNDGRYGWNSCRVPWRLSVDFLMSGEARSQTAVRKINAWIRQETGGDPNGINSGYLLSGEAAGGGADMAFLAPFGAAAMVEAESGSNQGWLNALWDEIVARNPQGYYGDSIKMLVLVTMSGNWWVP